MTVVGTPPPRLPVRPRASAPVTGVSPMLRRLADERATGVLLREHGVIYLADGQVVHAESPETPNLDVLLTTGGALNADAWQDAVAQAGARRRVGRFLVDSGRVTVGALELCHTGAVFDAAYFVLEPSAAPARFRYGASHWLGPVRPVPVAALERETLRRRALLQRIWPDPAIDRAPLVRADRGAQPSVPARQEAVLDQVDGVRTAADISLALGRPAFHTLVDLRRLAAAGIVEAAPPPPPPVLPFPAGGTDLPDRPVPGETPGDAHQGTPYLPAVAPGTRPVPLPDALGLPSSPPAAPRPPGATPLPAALPGAAPLPAPLPGAAPLPAAAGAPAPGAPEPSVALPPAGPPAHPATGTPAWPPSPLSALLAQPPSDPDVTLLRRLRDALEAL